MRWRLTLLVIVLAVVGAAVWWRETRKLQSTGSWAITSSGCYVPVGTPKQGSPGPVCGTKEAVTYCVYRNQRYGIGEQFAAEDRCNTCSCGLAGEVACSDLSQCANKNTAR